MALLQPQNTVPFGLALATFSAPIAPDAPVWLSIKIDWPRDLLNCSETMRKATSEALPTANGVTKVIELLGQVWA